MRSSDEQQLESGGNGCSADFATSTQSSVYSLTVKSCNDREARGNDKASVYEHNQSDTLIERDVPILYSTNRGLYLRLVKTISSGSSAMQGRLATQGVPWTPASAYDIRFCDLERWSTNRAHTVSLQDTFTITHQTSLPISSSDSDYRRSSKQSNCNKLALFRCNYTSFDTYQTK